MFLMEAEAARADEAPAALVGFFGEPNLLAFTAYAACVKFVFTLAYTCE